jgi:hypothetical protein
MAKRTATTTKKSVRKDSRTRDEEKDINNIPQTNSKKSTIEKNEKIINEKLKSKPLVNNASYQYTRIKLNNYPVSYDNSKEDDFTRVYDKLLSEVGLLISKEEQYILLVHAFILYSEIYKSASEGRLLPYDWHNHSESLDWQFNYSRRLKESMILDEILEMDGDNSNDIEIIMEFNIEGDLVVREENKDVQVDFPLQELSEINLNKLNISALSESFKEKMDMFINFLNVN